MIYLRSQMSWLIKFFQVSLCLIQLRNVIHLQWQKTNRKKMLTRNVRSSYNFATSGSIIHFTTIVAVLTVATKIRFIWKPHTRLSLSSMAAIMKGSCRRIAALWIDFYLLSNSLDCQHRGPKRFVRWKKDPDTKFRRTNYWEHFLQQAGESLEIGFLTQMRNRLFKA